LSATKKIKIAILGGGIAALTTAFELTEADPAYDITVYQLGWRLGGKGASGRNPACHQRIEEHGLHLWAGANDNAFRMMRACYQALKRPAGCPFATWQEAFTPHKLLVLRESYQGQAYDWTLELPANFEEPGGAKANLFLSPWSYLSGALQLMRQVSQELLADKSLATSPLGPPDPLTRRLVARLAGPLADTLGRGQQLLLAAQLLADRLGGPETGLVDRLAQIYERSLKLLGQNGKQFSQSIILKLLALFMESLWPAVKPRLDHFETRRYWITLNFIYGNVRGIIVDDLIERGLATIDDQDYRHWLGQHIIDDQVEGQALTLNSPLALFLYTTFFAYRDGDLSQPDLSAGVALHILLRLAFTSKGAVLWKMEAGMGDTVFSPLYQLLKQRGVKFKFFHRVKALHLAAGKQTVAAITIGQQAQLNGQAEYEPLITVKGLACWPSQPRYEQLVGGDKLQGVDFEAGDSADEVDITLKAGQDFDQIVLGIPLAALPALCSELIDANRRWQEMVTHLKTVPTQALQLWLKPSRQALGWPLAAPILGNVPLNPLHTWADMSHLLAREAWPAEPGAYPLNLAYFCGPLADRLADSPNGATEQSRVDALDLLNHHLGSLWPEAVNGAGRPGFCWELLVDNRAEPASGADRLAAHYLRANSQPAERYVQSISGSTRYRLHPGHSGFANLYLAGDWTWNAINAGCIEAAVISGMLAAQALSGQPASQQIVGLNFGQPLPQYLHPTQQFSVWLKTGPVSRLRAARLSRSFRQTRKTGPV
jgi:uncharacterized protein with NAD-binding domain and iron-sulfur cluster